MPRPLRIALFGVFVLVLLLGAFSSLAAVRVRAPFPQTTGSIDLGVLAAEVEVVRDAAGVPHLYGDSVDDLYAAQGYVQAQDRFFEMDVRRHLTAGRLAELFGEAVLESDVTIRTLGWRRVAEQEIGLLSAESRRALQAHASGVNAYLASREPEEIALEYSVLGLQTTVVQPEPWTPADSVSWLKAMAWNLSDARTVEAERAQLVELLGAERAEQLYPRPDLAELLPVLPDGGLADGSFDAEARAEAPGGGSGGGLGVAGPDPAPLAEGAVEALAKAAGSLDALPAALGAPAADGLGSNAWVLSGEHTDSSSPILSNDPHLGLSAPSPFVQVGLHCRQLSEDCDLDVSGFSFAGMPGVVIGRNADIAWGFTTPYLDTEDWVLERVRPDGTVYREDGWQPLQTRVERIRVADEDDPVQVVVRSTELGPLLSDVDESAAELGPQTAPSPVGEPPGTAAGAETDGLAPGEAWGAVLQSTTLQPGRNVDALLRLNRARDFEEFRAAVSLLSTPAQNIVYADAGGSIGYQLPGAVPIRDGRDGSTPVPGWSPAAAWLGSIPFDQLPWALDPPDGFLVSANQSVIGPDFPYPLHTSPSQGWRSQQLHDRLTAATADGATLDLDAAQELFADTQMRYAAPLVEPFAEAPALEPWVADGQRLLTDWDGRAEADSAAAAWFHLVLRETLVRTFHDELPEPLRPTSSDRWMAVLGELVERPDDPFWDDVTTPEVETRDDILAAASLTARRQATAEMNLDPATWSWGRLHRVELSHPTLGSSGVGLLESVFNVSGPAVGGSSGVVEAMAWSTAREDFTPVAGPAMRMLVDLSDPDAARWINQSGSSGHAFHPHYDDQVDRWAANEMMPFRHTRESILADPEPEVLRLLPMQ